jgi:hypothetical protein
VIEIALTRRTLLKTWQAHVEASLEVKRARRIGNHNRRIEDHKKKIDEP